MKKSFVVMAGILGCITIVALFLRQPWHRSEQAAENVLIVGTNAEYPPFTFMQNNEIVGFDISLMREVCRRLGFTMQLKDMSFDILVPEVQRGSIDLIAAGMTPTPERAQALIFTDAYYTGDPLVIVSSLDHPIKNLDELISGASVVVNDGYTADIYMSGIAGVQLRRLPNPAGAFLALESGRTDAYVTAQSTVASFLKNNDKNFSVIPLPGTAENYAFALSPQRADLLPKINDLLRVLKEEGFLKTLEEKWGLAHD